MRPLPLLLAAACLDPRAPGTLVPATVVDDPSLPAATIEVRGVRRRVHLLDEGPADAPVVLVMPGAACDVVPYLPFTALADAWRVVLWDPRGNGLSERVGADELAFDDLPLEIEAVRALVAGDAPVVLVGHSWSAAVLVRYLAQYPEHVAGLVLMEPPALRRADQADHPIDVSVVSGPYLDLAWSQWSTGTVDHERLDFAATALLQPGVPTFHCDPDDPPWWPIARPGGLATVVWQSTLITDRRFDYPFTAGLGRPDAPVLLVGSSCSVIGADFQAEVNLPLFPRGELLRIRDSGHRIPVEQPDALVAGVRDWLGRLP